MPIEIEMPPEESMPSVTKGNGKEITEEHQIGDTFDLRLSDIIVIPGENAREKFDREKLTALSKNMQVVGQLNPIQVAQQADGTYRLVAGERRYRAAKQAGYAKLKVLLVNSNPVDIRLARLSENIHRENLTPLEEAKELKGILGQKIVRGTKTDIINSKLLAEKTGKSEGWVSQRLALLELPQEIQDGMQGGEVPFAIARELRAIHSPEQQLEYYRKLVSDKKQGAHDIKRAAEKARHVKARAEKAAGIPSTPVGPAPDFSKIGESETLQETLRQTKLDFRKKDEIREGIATAWERMKRSRTPETEQYWKGVLAGFEYSAGLRDEI